MDKKFIFVNLSIESGYNTGLNHGIAFLTPIVKRHSYDVTCLNIRYEISCEEFRNKIADYNPSIVGFSCTSHQLKYLLKYSKELEKYPRILQIAGGVGSTLDPEWILSRTPIKGACVGEGEIPLDNLLNNIENKQDVFDTEGFHWRVDGKVKKNPTPQFISDLSTLNFPDYSLFDKDIVCYEGTLLVMLSRGCPNNCHYCCNKALAGVYSSPRGYFRLPSVEYSIRLLEERIKYHQETKFVFFEDDLIIANKVWFKLFSEEYRKRIAIPYRTCARVESLTPEVVGALKHSGCRCVYVGLESGNENLRRNILNRKYSNRLFIERCKLIKEAGIDLYLFNIVGFPFETKKEMKDTLKLNKRIAPNSGVCTFFYPYKGSELYRICKDNNLLKTEYQMNQITNYNTSPSIKMSALQEKDCIYFQKKLMRYLLRREELMKISKLPFGFKKCSIALYYSGKSVLGTTQSLYKIVRWVYRRSGIKSLMRFRDNIGYEKRIKEL